MTPEQYAAIKSAVLADPQLSVLAGQGAVFEIARLLNSTPSAEPAERIITDRTMMAEMDLQVCGSVMGKLEALSTSNVLVRRAWARLTGDGLDIGNPKTLAMIDSLTGVAQGMFTAEEGAALKALATTRKTVAQVVAGGPVTEDDVTAALRG